MKISCPVTPVISQPTPSVLCSHFGMLITIEGAREAEEKHRVKGKLNEANHFNLLLNINEHIVLKLKQNLLK